MKKISENIAKFGFVFSGGVLFVPEVKVLLIWNSIYSALYLVGKSSCISSKICFLSHSIPSKCSFYTIFTTFHKDRRMSFETGVRAYYVFAYFFVKVTCI